MICNAKTDVGVEENGDEEIQNNTTETDEDIDAKVGYGFEGLLSALLTMVDVFGKF